MTVYVVMRTEYYFVSKCPEITFIDRVFASMESAMKYISDMSRKYSNDNATEDPYTKKGDHSIYIFLNNFDYMGWCIIKREVIK